MPLDRRRNAGRRSMTTELVVRLVSREFELQGLPG
jgi:hypothetical protein